MADGRSLEQRCSWFSIGDGLRDSAARTTRAECLEHHFLQTVQPHGRPGWLTAAGSLMGPGAIAMSNLLEGELKAYNTSSNSTVESFRFFFEIFAWNEALSPPLSCRERTACQFETPRSQKCHSTEGAADSL